MSREIYFDYNATTPLASEVAAVLRDVLNQPFGNPSSYHRLGELARERIEQARGQVAKLLGCDATEIVFTSGGTEANNFAIKGMFFAAREKKTPHFVISAVEHPAIVQPCRFLERLGAEVTVVPVDRHGRIDPKDVQRAIKRNTVLVSVMHANNEVGTIQPIPEIAEIAHAAGTLLHTDAAQSVGKVPVDVYSMGVDLLTVAGHKLYAPQGVGALFVRDGVELEPILHGAGHEAGRRAGTENILEIAGLGAACELACCELNLSTITCLRDYFWDCLQSKFGDRVVLNGHLSERLPNTLNVSFPGHAGDAILAQLPGVAASTGAACHAGSAEISSVLRAMNVSEAVGLGAIRFSLGRGSTQEEVEEVVERLSFVLAPSSTAV